MLSDHSVEVDPDESLTRIRTPMTQQPILKMFFTQRTLEERIVAEIDHAHAEIVAGTPIGIDCFELIRTDRFLHPFDWVRKIIGCCRWHGWSLSRSCVE